MWTKYFLPVGQPGGKFLRPRMISAGGTFVAPHALGTLETPEKYG
jgi:hypothetical protein